MTQAPTTPAGLRYRNTFDQLVEAGLMDERTALSLKSGLLAIEQEAAVLERRKVVDPLLLGALISFAISPPTNGSGVRARNNAVAKARAILDALASEPDR